MKKYSGVMLAMAAAVMITACSSLSGGGNTKNTETGTGKESTEAEAQTDTIKIVSESDPEPSSAQETAPETETTAPAPESQPGKAEVPAYSVTAVKKTMYVTQPVHVRASYTTRSDVLTSFGTGRMVSVTGQSANGWMQISYNGKNAYIYKKYLSDSKPKTETGNETNTIQETTPAPPPPQDHTQTGQNETNSSNPQNPPVSPPSSPGSNDNIPIVEPSPLTPTAGMQNTNSPAGPGSSTPPGGGAGTGGGIITPHGPGM